ncbi:MAG TPA: TonB family protein [Pyrinomonadaceae bacterium]|jgi:TonB family protein
MAKIVKFCDSCEESFAEKFGFCPNCGGKLQAFEMNPLGGAAAISEPVKSETDKANNVIEEKTFSTDAEPTAPVIAHSAAEPVISSNETKNFDAPKVDDFQPSINAEKTEPVVEAPKTFAASAGAKSGGTNGNNDRKDVLNSSFSPAGSPVVDDGFHVTVIEEKNVKTRNTLLLGALFLMTTLAVGSTIYSLFSKDLLVGSIGDEGTLSALVEAVEPPPIETEPPPKKDKDEGGGGGGGGKQEQQEASKGRLPPQSRNPITPPDVNIPQLTNPTLKLKQETQGDIKRPITEERTGIPTSLNLSASNGTGSGGGIGSGRGTGVGGGIGTGEGNGIGSGSGNGRGNGTGNGTGDGSGGVSVPPPPPPKRPDPPKPAVTTAMRIVSKPRANYTDAARQNQVQGTVTLRVTFLASGQIGSISPVSGLPYGLTEQAIAAARQIRFEPQMVNGSPVAVTKQVQYSFTIY